MKFYQKRGFALVVLVLAILGSCVYGISKKPADLPQVSYGNWLQDDADLLTDETEASLRQYDQSWDSDYRAIIAVATLDTLNGWTYEKAAAELGSQWGLGGNDMLLLLVKDSDYYVALGDNVLDAMTDTYQAGLQGAVESGAFRRKILPRSTRWCGLQRSRRGSCSTPRQYSIVPVQYTFF